MGLTQLNEYFAGKAKLLEKSAVITFDDGFRDNYENALPILSEFGYPATVFVTAGFISSEGRGAENVKYMDREMLSWRQLREMQNNGVTIGAHTITHPKLPDIGEALAREEIAGSKIRIEDELQKEVKDFAYPYGLYDAATREIVVEEGFESACTTRSGFNSSRSDPYLLRRIEVYGADPVWKLAQKMTFGVTDASVFLPLRYYSKRLKTKVSDRV